MAAPTSYSEITLATYMRDGILKDISTALNWTLIPDDYQEAINSALLMMDVDAISEIAGRSNIAKLRIAAQIAVWQQVISAVAGDYDFSADGGSYSRSQIHAMATKNLDRAESDGYNYGLTPNYTVDLINTHNRHDPYVYTPDENVTL